MIIPTLQVLHVVHNCSCMNLASPLHYSHQTADITVADFTGVTNPILLNLLYDLNLQECMKILLYYTLHGSAVQCIHNHYHYKNNYNSIGLLCLKCPNLSKKKKD